METRLVPRNCSDPPTQSSRLLVRMEGAELPLFVETPSNAAWHFELSELTSGRPFIVSLVGTFYDHL